MRLRLSLVPLLEEIIERDKDKSERQKTKEIKELHHTHTPFALKLYAIENSIYGVDKEQSAVEIARLRLWLSLIVDEEDLSEDKTLPNLDYKIGQGNSLLNEFRGLELIPFDFVVKHTAKSLLPDEDLKKKGKTKADSLQGDLLRVEGGGKQKIKQLHAIHQEIFKSKEKREKERLRREADRIILEFINEHLTQENTRLEDSISKTREELKEEKANVRRSFKEDRVTPRIKSLSRMLESLEERLAKRKESQLALKNLWQKRESKESARLDLADISDDNFTTVKAKDFMLWELQFVEMFFDADGNTWKNGGFDIVIANPPYIRHEKTKPYKAAFKRRFTTYAGTADILVYFYEQAVNILRQYGTLTFITSNKYFRASYGEGLRELLGANTRIKQIIDFGDAPVFRAAAYASIIVLSKEPVSNYETRVWTFPQHETVENFEDGFNRLGFHLPQRELKAEGWRLEPPHVLRLFEEIKSRGTPLGEYVKGRFYRGILTGLNEAFVIPRWKRDKLIEEDEKYSEILKPYLRGRDIKRWQANNPDLWLIFTRHGTDIKKYPAVRKLLEEYKPQLMPTGKKDPKNGKSLSRKVGSYKWYEIQDNVAYWEEFEQVKIIVPAIELNAACAVDDIGFFSNDKTSICVTSEPRFLSAILNSTVSWWMIQKTASGKQNGYYEFKPMYVAELPIPSAEDWQKEIIEKLVDYILFLTKTDGEKLLVNYFESIINGCAYELFLPEELHAADKRFFESLNQESLPVLSEHAGNELKVIREMFERLSNVNHPIRSNLYFLSNLESVRIMEGK